MSNTSIDPQTKITRRDFLKITAIAGMTIGLGTAIGRKFLSLNGPVRISETHYLMGTIVNFNVIAIDEDQGRAAIRKTVTEMERLIAIFDHRPAGTALKKLNQDGVLNDAPIELLETIKRSLELGSLSQGAFDITVLPIVEAFKAGLSDTTHLKNLVDFRQVLVNGDQIHFARLGMSITLDGIAKGRIIDSGVAALKSMGFDNVLVEAGGDMMAASSETEGQPWNIAISNPRPSDGQQFIASFSVKNKAVTTSGDYLNYFTSDYSQYHIIDPRTGQSPSELASATVIAHSAAEADALSTTLMVMGVREGLEFIQQLPGVQALVVTKDLSVHKTADFPTTF